MRDLIIILILTALVAVLAWITPPPPSADVARELDVWGKVQEPIQHPIYGDFEGE